MTRTVQCFFGLAAVVLVAFVGTGCTAKTKVTRHLHQAEQYFAADKYAQAEIEFKQALRNDPQCAEAWSGLGIIYFNEGSLLQSASLLARAKQLNPENLKVRIKLGITLLVMGQVKAARDEADFVLQRNPNDKQAPILLANTAVTTNDMAAVRQQLQDLRQRKDSAPVEVALGILALRERAFKTADACLNRAVTLNPKCSEAFTALGGLYVARKDFKRAEAAFRKAAELDPVWSGSGLRYAEFKLSTGEPEAAKRLLKDMVNKTPDYLPAWIVLAQMSAKKRDFTQVQALLDNVLARDPNNFEALVMRGQLQLLHGDAPKAIADFKMLSKIFPRLPVIHYLLAQAYLANQQADQAGESLDEALRLNPKYVNAGLLQAAIQIKQGNTADAITTLTKLTQEHPRIFQAWLLLGDAYRAQDSLDRAVRVYERLETGHPDNFLIPLRLGACLQQQQQYIPALAQYEKALQKAPDYLPAVKQCVDLELRLKQYSNSLDRVEQGIRKHPDQAAWQILLGRIWEAQGNTNRAEAAWSKAVALQPDAPAAHLWLARLRITAGQPRRAETELNSVLDRHPNNVAALMLLGGLYDSQKEYQDARETYEKVISISTNNATALNNLAYLYSERLHWLDKAAVLARQATEIAPGQPAFADTLGWILFRKGQYAAALSLLQESAAKLNQLPEAQFHLGMAGYMNGNEQVARTAFEHALQLPGEFPERAECRQRLDILDVNVQTADAETRVKLERWVAERTNDPVALGRLAGIYQRLGLTNRAAMTYQALLQIRPANVNAMVQLARLDARTDVRAAYALAMSAYKLSPNDADVTRLAGRLAFQTGDFSWALSLLQLAAQAQPDDPGVLFDLGEAFYSQGRVTEARAAMQRALKTGSAFVRSRDARQFLTLTALAASPAEALKKEAQLSEILKAKPDDIPALMVKAAIAGQKANHEAAERTYEQVLKHYPDFAPAKKRLAILYAQEPGKEDRACALAVQVRKVFPKDQEIIRLLGMIYYRQGQYSRAVEILKSGLPLQGQGMDPVSMFYLGMAQYHLKQITECKSALQESLALNLTGKLAAEAKRVLAKPELSSSLH